MKIPKQVVLFRLPQHCLVHATIFFFRVPASHRVQFRNAGTHRLKNVMDEVELFELFPGEKNTLLDVYPVCHMHVDSSKLFYSCQHEGSTYHFCSERCLQLFQANPVRENSNAAGGKSTKQKKRARICR